MNNKMRRILFGVIAAILTLTVGIVTFTYWRTKQKEKLAASIVVDLDQEKLAAQELIKRGVQFELGNIIDGSNMKERYSFFAEDYNSSDGVSLFHVNNDFKSKARAEREFKRRIDNAVKIIERAPLLDNAGRTTGEKAIAVSSVDGSRAKEMIIFWTKGSELLEITSPTLRHALALEQSREF